MSKNTADEAGGGKAETHIFRAYLPKPLHEKLSSKGSHYIERISHILQDVVKDPWKLRGGGLYRVPITSSERVNDVRGRLSTGEMQKLKEIQSALELSDGDLLINAIAQALGENLAHYERAKPIRLSDATDFRLAEIAGKKPKTPILAPDPNYYEAVMKDPFAERVREQVAAGHEKTLRRKKPEELPQGYTVKDSRKDKRSFSERFPEDGDTPPKSPPRVG